MKLALAVACATFVLGLTVTSAKADCWRLRDGRIVTTAAQSTPPMAGARRVTCPSPTLPSPGKAQQPPQIKTEVRTEVLGPDSRECVEFARSRVSSLPTGLISFDDKKRIINSNRPSVGSVAIIRVPNGPSSQYGHVAVVEGVTSTSITITESNFGGRHIQRRTATAPSQAEAANLLRIEGYFRP